MGFFLPDLLRKLGTLSPFARVYVFGLTLFATVILLWLVGGAFVGVIGITGIALAIAAAMGALESYVRRKNSN